MAKLHQILALEKGMKNKREKVQTAAYQLFQAPQPFQGIARQYTPRDDDGEQLPPESQLVQARVADTLEGVSESIALVIDLMVTKDSANTEASGSIELEDGTVIAADVPVTTLLSLEKLLVDVRTMVLAVPVLDPSMEWEFDEVSDAYKSAVKVTTRSKKVPKNHVVAEATEHHPAQVQVFTEDIIVGDWETYHLSGAVPATAKKESVERIEAMQRAVKIAREQANDQAAPDVKIGEDLMEYMLAPLN